MDYAGIDPGNPFLWFTLSGLLCGGGISFLLHSSKKRRPAVFSVMLSFALLCLLAALIVSGFSISDCRMKLFWTGAFVAAGIFCFRFWKTVGIPVFFLSVIFMSGAWYSFSGWSGAGQGKEICKCRTISEGSDFIRIQYEDEDGLSGINKVQGSAVYPVLDIVTAPDYFFILNKPAVYRFYGFGASPVINGGTEGGFTEVFFDLVTRLPGFNVNIGAAAAVQFSPSIEYLLVFGNEVLPELKRQI